MKDMILIVGLGNPGIKYKRTRHNIGFRVLDEFQRENNFPDFKFFKKFNALIFEGNIGRKKVILAKPQTFMNNSGQAVKNLTIHYSLPFINLIVVHDDIDLPLGKIRISKSRGSAGHKGIESIIKELRSKNFVRIRIGIRNQELRIKNIEKFVLQKFTEEEEKIIKKIIKESCSALKIILSEGLEKAMNKFNI
ncbi:MAG: aminoacyl-tRNA hydrolase [Parcubacteria group bacterium CG2_30_36_21]|nr:MAG: aminoacyl-tRNA hydrolase [Parcubacteria group bacterium CG2_30_36_21]